MGASVVLTLGLVWGMAACTDRSPSAGRAAEDSLGADSLLASIPGSTRAVAFRCTAPADSFLIGVRAAPDAAALWLPAPFGPRTVALRRVRTASGTKYARGGVSVWQKGAEARLTVRGQTFDRCVEAPRQSTWVDAWLRGVDARALGNEPGWILEVTRGARLRFVYAYGEDTVAGPAPTPTRRANRVVYRTEAGGHALTATFRDTLCRDVMSGARFPAAAAVTYRGTTYHGCGWVIGVAGAE